VLEELWVHNGRLLRGHGAVLVKVVRERVREALVFVEHVMAGRSGPSVAIAT
jgi:hypothetical protein